LEWDIDGFLMGRECTDQGLSGKPRGVVSPGIVADRRDDLVLDERAHLTVAAEARPNGWGPVSHGEPVLR
jgi:hypothetical protein